MKSLTFFALAAALVLGGCWESNTLLLDSSQGDRPLADGRYARAGAGLSDEMTVRWLGNGLYQVTREAEDPSLMTLILLSEIDGRPAYAAALSASGCSSVAACRSWDYAVVFVDKGRVLLATPDCQGDVGLARKYQARIIEDGEVCLFGEQYNLLGALTEFAHAPGKLEEYVSH
ncbi:hypothetical protein QO010_003294 [Caulobacter ginsengisoli]|uniref:Lipoprotein n=1 Tax=Caulobacter ginsengisoli TaxID=400775 RepID=A0ABU0IU23_9CAUL|nr:hypothetical protein [Caulobacter ginsengisoli]MDQ0465505.1 hypothetical protein [Caulobacter ginsengisoli]